MPDAVGSLSNEDLLRRYQQGDVAAFNEFFHRHKTLVFRLLLAKLGSASEADEAFQETFLRVHKYVLGFSPDRSAVGWLLGIPKNAAIDHHHRRRPTTQLPPDLPDATDLAARLQARAELVDLFHRVDAADRDLLIRRFLDDESFDSIAKAQGVRSDSVRQRVSRLAKRLRSNG